MKYITSVIIYFVGLVSICGCSQALPTSIKNDLQLGSNYTVTDIGLNKVTVRHEGQLIIVDIDSSAVFQKCSSKEVMRDGVYISREKCEPEYQAPDYLYKFATNKQTGIMVGISFDRSSTKRITSYWLNPMITKIDQMTDKEIAKSFVAGKR